MARFYINFRNGDEIAKDDEDRLVRQELRDNLVVLFRVLPLRPMAGILHEMVLVAREQAREILADNVKGDAKDPLQAVIITDERGREIMTIPAKEVLPDPLK